MSRGGYNPRGKPRLVIKRGLNGSYNVEREQKDGPIVSFRRLASFPTKEQAESYKRQAEVGRV